MKSSWFVVCRSWLVDRGSVLKSRWEAQAHSIVVVVLAFIVTLTSSGLPRALHARKITRKTWLHAGWPSQYFNTYFFLRHIVRV
jgi:RsiW-degrading membrane proteinase PrsW (M82 family)